jgi:predicted DNA-binding ribbon-helix-helix protein
MNALKEIAAAKDHSINELVAKIDKGRQSGNLSSAIRQFVLAYYQGSHR